MAQTTANYGLFKPESTDTYNHLVYDNPNMDTIDAAMKANADHAVDNASCIKSGTVHSVTRTNTSCPVFKFTATGDWNTGDTMNVDGTPVSVFLPNGSAPLTGCFVINTEVLAIISGSRVTLMCPVIPDASDIAFDPTGTTLSSTDVENAIKDLNDSENIDYNGISVKQKLTNLTPTNGGSIGTQSALDDLAVNSIVYAFVGAAVSPFNTGNWATIQTIGQSGLIKNQSLITSQGIAYRHWENNIWSSWTKVAFS